MKPTTREQQTLETHKKFQDRLKDARTEVLRNKYENVLFYDGHQWLSPLPDGRGFIRANLRRDVPRPVTNRYKAILDAVDAPMSRLEPALECVPDTDKDIDRVSARFGNMVIDHVSEQVELDRFKGELSKIVSVCCDAYGHAGWDPDGGVVERVPKWACASCNTPPMSADKAQESGGTCPTCQTPLKPSRTAADELPQGAQYLEAVTPFETWVDYAIPRMEDQPAVMIRRMRTRQWAEVTFPQLKEQIEKLPNCGTETDVGMTYLQSIIRLTPAGTSGMIGFGAAVQWDQSIIDDVLYMKPCAEYPDGLYLRVLSNQLVADDRSLRDVANMGTPEQPGRPYVPVVHYGYDNVPGTHTHTGPADHLKDLQRQRNRREAAIELYFSRMANGVWLIPEGTDVQTPSGEEGWVLRYSPMGASGAKPERVEGSRLPTSFVDWLTFLDKQMEDVAGTYDIFRGERPPNVSSGYAMQILAERAQSRFAHVYANYEIAHAALGKMLFLLFRQHAPETTYYSIKGEESRWTVQTIRRADIGGNIHFKVEAGSARPRTSLEKRAGAEQLISLGVVDLMNPEVRLRLHHMYGVPELMASADADSDHVAREHAALIAWARQITDPQTGQPVQGMGPEQMMLPILVDPLVDNHKVHAPQHRRFMLSDEFRALPDWIQKSFRDGHYTEHLYEIELSLQTGDPLVDIVGGGPMAAAGPMGGAPAPGGGGGKSSPQAAGAARAQGQERSMQNGGNPPGRGAPQGQQMAAAAQPQ